MGYIEEIREDEVIGDIGLVVSKSPGATELRRESFVIIGPDYGDNSRNAYVEFLLTDLDDVIAALLRVRARVAAREMRHATMMR